MQVQHALRSRSVAVGPTWVDRPDLVDTRVAWDTAIGRDLATSDPDRLTDAVFRHFDRSDDDRLLAREAMASQQWTFASDAAGSDRPQYLYSHSTVRQEVVSIEALQAAAAGADGVLERGELRTFLESLDLSGGLTFDAAFAPAIVRARQLTVPGRLAGATRGHLIEDAWDLTPR